MLSGPVEGRLLELLVHAVRARLVLELGTYSGFSALSMAAGLAPGGRIVTCEISADHAEFARRRIEACPYAERIDLRVGPALETIATLDGPFDLVFIDADKPGYAAYYEAVLPKLSGPRADRRRQHAVERTRSSSRARRRREHARPVAFNDRRWPTTPHGPGDAAVRDGVTIRRR